MMIKSLIIGCFPVEELLFVFKYDLKYFGWVLDGLVFGFLFVSNFQLTSNDSKHLRKYNIWTFSGSAKTLIFLKYFKVLPQILLVKEDNGFPTLF